MKVNHKECTFVTSDGLSVDVDFHKQNFLPVMNCFLNAIKVAENLALEGSVISVDNTNLTFLQKTLLKWHYKLGHLGFQHVQFLGRQSWLGSVGYKIGKTTVQPPKCAACQFGKQARTPKAGSKQTRQKASILSKEKLSPGELVYTDQFESRALGHVFGGRGASISRCKYKGGTLFCDAASNKIFVVHQVGFTPEETIGAKHRFEREAASVGVDVKMYSSDNGIYTSKGFKNELEKDRQSIQHSGVGGHHHNATAETSIKHVVKTALTMMIHAALRWPEESDKSLWPLAVNHAVHLHNHTPQKNSGLSPEEIWTRSTSSHSHLLNAHPWGCPVYVLQPKLQDGMKIPKWEPKSRRGQYVGHSPLHASTVGLVRNLKTQNISPQYHVVYDDWFETVQLQDHLFGIVLTPSMVIQQFQLMFPSF